MTCNIIMKFIPFVVLMTVHINSFSDEMTIAKLQDIINSKESSDIIDELKIYPACDQINFSQTMTMPSGESIVDTESASEWYVVGNFLVVKSTLPDKTNTFLVKSYDKANHIYHGWCIHKDKIMFTQIGMYDSEYKIMTWHTNMGNELSGFWSISIQRFVSDKRNEWLTNAYNGTDLAGTQIGSCDYNFPSKP